MSALMRAAVPIALVASLFALQGCGGGDSEPEVVTVTETVTDTGGIDTESTDTIPTDSDGTATDPTGEIPPEALPTGDPEFGVGDTATWNSEEFVVSDAGTSDEEPVEDLGGEKDEAVVGTWLYFKVTPSEEDSGVWSTTFAEEVQVRGGDGIVYREDVHIDSFFQNEVGEDSFTVWVDVPEEAVSGAVFEIGDGLHTIDPAPDDAFSFVTYPDPAYMTRVDLGT